MRYEKLDSVLRVREFVGKFERSVASCAYAGTSYCCQVKEWGSFSANADFTSAQITEACTLLVEKMTEVTREERGGGLATVGGWSGAWVKALQESPNWRLIREYQSTSNSAYQIYIFWCDGNEDIDPGEEEDDDYDD